MQHSFELLVDKVPYFVKVTPYEFNTETRFKVSYNGSPEHIFTWDSSLGRLAPIVDESSVMPGDLEVVIATKMQGGRFK